MTSLFTYFKKAPPFEVWESHPGEKSKILITAGIDGDEYQGIDLARQIISSYNLDTAITVIPIVNIPGYSAKTSLNPLDGHYPKYIFPGSPHGSSSSRLMYEVSKYTKGKKLWLDLHCGAIGETLSPFIWAPSPYPVLSYLNTQILVEASIDKKMPYILIESGELTWITSIIKNLDKPAKLGWTPTYTKVKFEKYIGQKPDSKTLWYSKDIFVSAS